MEKIIVLAGNYEQFERFLGENGLTTTNAIYGDFHHMAGTEATESVVIGTFWDRKDAKDAYEFAHTRIKPPKNTK